MEHAGQPNIDALLAELEAAHAVGVRQEALIMEREAELAALKASPVSLQAANDVCTIDCLNDRVMRLMIELADERIRGLQLLADAKEWQQMLMKERAELAALKGQQPVQWQKRHQSRTDGLWENTNEHDAKWWRDNAKGWEVRPLFLAAGAQTIPAGYQLVPAEPTAAMKTAAIGVEVYSESPAELGALTWHEASEIYKAMLAAAPVQAGAQPAPTGSCRLCGADAPFTGSCGGGRNNPKALCYESAPVQAVVKDSLTTQEPTPLEVRLVDTLLGQAQEPFAPDWAGYRQGKADGIAEAQERKPLTDEQCQAVIDSMPTYDAWGRTDKEGDVNLHEFARALEAAHNIKEQP